MRDAEQRYAVRYRRPRPNPERVVVVLDVDRVLGGTWPDPLPPVPVRHLTVPTFPPDPEPSPSHQNRSVRR